jgi:hypothetical protein
VIKSDDPAVSTFGPSERLDIGTYNSSIFVSSEPDEDCGISFNFTGTSIALYAPPRTNLLPPLPYRSFDLYFNSSLHPQPYDQRAFRNIYSRQSLQFQANGLPQGEHRVVLRCIAGSARNTSLGFDHAVVVVPEVYAATDVCFVNCTCGSTLGFWSQSREVSR